MSLISLSGLSRFVSSSSGRRRRLLTGLVVPVVASLLLSGCGAGVATGDGDPSTKKDDTAAGVFDKNSTMAMIQDRGKLIVGVSYDDSPYAHIDSSTGTPAGFDIEIVKQIAVGIFGSNIENHLQFIETDPVSRDFQLQQNRVDIVVGRFPITVADKKLIDFAGPYYVAHQQILMRQVRGTDDEITTFTDLNNRKVCVVKGSADIDALKKVIPNVDASLMKDTVPLCGAAVQDGQAAAIVADYIDMLDFQKQNRSQFEVLGEEFGPKPYGIGVKRGVDDWRAYINDRLSNQISEVWDELYKQTMGAGDDEQPPVDRYSR